MKNYISVFDNVLEDNFCKNLREKFERSKDVWVRRDDKFKTFNEINFGQYPIFAEEQNTILSKVQPYVKKYCEQWDIKFFPEQIGFEQVRMKKYEVGGKEEFRHHVDVGDYASARRFLVMFFYLNNVAEGGETAFIGINDDQMVQPKTGRLLMFPPMWTHPHAGLPPITNPKYIVGTYLHYT
jgi:hypothetical protein